jgi:hypothetical protein
MSYVIDKCFNEYNLVSHTSEMSVQHRVFLLRMVEYSTV